MHVVLLDVVLKYKNDIAANNGYDSWFRGRPLCIPAGWAAAGHYERTCY